MVIALNKLFENSESWHKLSSSQVDQALFDRQWVGLWENRPGLLVHFYVLLHIGVWACCRSCRSLWLCMCEAAVRSEWIAVGHTTRQSIAVWWIPVHEWRGADKANIGTEH